MYGPTHYTSRSLAAKNFMNKFLNKADALASDVIAGIALTPSEAIELTTLELEPLCEAAERIRHVCRGDCVDLCCILNAKSGRCSENCRYCAQSTVCHAAIDEYPLVSVERIVEAGRQAAKDRIGRFSVVTSGRKLAAEEIDVLVRAFEKLHAEGNISLCASLGLQTADEFKTLKNAPLCVKHVCG